MCTVSWLHHVDGYELFCNRDERRSRAAAISPRIQKMGDVRYVAPSDGDLGGTWIGANEFGVSICLLNGTPGAAGRVSRGLLVLDLLSSESIQQAQAWLKDCDLSRFAPFTLVLLEPGLPAGVVLWDGRKSSFRVNNEPLLISSTYDPDGVRWQRREAFRRLGAVNSTTLHEFHRSHGEGPSPYSVCMHRVDAATVSFSRVRVGTSEVEFFYAAGAPCRNLRSERVCLSLR